MRIFLCFSSGVLTELCDFGDACSLDARAFKGIFLRNLRYLMDVSQNIDLLKPEVKEYQIFIDRNVRALMANATCFPTR